MLKYWALFMLLLFIPGYNLTLQSALAETPAETVSQILKEVKSHQSIVPMFEHVDWQSAYKEIGKSGLRYMEVNSASELKAYFKQMFTNPEATISKQMRKLRAKMNAGQPKGSNAGQMNDALIEQMSRTFAAKIHESSKKFSNTTWIIGKSKIKDNRASVEVTLNDGKSDPRKQIVQLVKVGDEWLLSTLDLGRNALRQGFTGNGPAAGGAKPTSPANHQSFTPKMGQ